MALEDIKDRIVSESKALWDRVQDTSTFQSFKERYENLSSIQQRLVLFGAIAFVVLVILSVPYSTYESSSDSVQNFEAKRNLIRELFKVTKQSSEVPMLPPSPNSAALVEQINTMLKTAQLIPEQIKNVTLDNPHTRLIAAASIDSAITVMLSRLNLNQVIDVGYQLQSISPAVKMTDMMVQANAQDTRYQDVTFHLVTLKVPQVSMEGPVGGEEMPPPPKGRANSRGGNNKKDRGDE